MVAWIQALSPAGAMRSTPPVTLHAQKRSAQSTYRSRKIPRAPAISEARSTKDDKNASFFTAICANGYELRVLEITESWLPHFLLSAFLALITSRVLRATLYSRASSTLRHSGSVHLCGLERSLGALPLFFNVLHVSSLTIGS